MPPEKRDIFFLFNAFYLHIEYDGNVNRIAGVRAKEKPSASAQQSNLMRRKKFAVCVKEKPHMLREVQRTKRAREGRRFKNGK